MAVDIDEEDAFNSLVLCVWAYGLTGEATEQLYAQMMGWAQP